ncbi:hypothetical protein ZWY2020_017113 [Hordeum vulgare]|nr:hypothetical protein ZWY2020_017113 [Hordeum vulgare]
MRTLLCSASDAVGSSGSLIIALLELLCCGADAVVLCLEIVFAGAACQSCNASVSTCGTSTQRSSATDAARRDGYVLQELERAIELLSHACSALTDSLTGTSSSSTRPDSLAVVSSSIMPMLITFVVAMHAIHRRAAAIDQPPLHGVAALELLVICVVAIAAAVSLSI